MEFADFLPWLITAGMAALSLIFGRTDKSGAATAAMQIDIAKIKTMLETMQNNHGSLEERQKARDIEQDRIFQEHKAHNSERHKSFFEALENLERRVQDLERR